MRESIIDHKPGHVFVMLRSDYLEIAGHPVAAQILSLFEYWANGVLANNPNHGLETIALGKRIIRKKSEKFGGSIEEGLLCSVSEKTIRSQIKDLEAKGFISTQTDSFNQGMEFFLHVRTINQAIRGADVSDPPCGKSSDPLGKTSEATLGKTSERGDRDRSQSGHEDQTNSTLGSFTDRLYIRKEDLLKEEEGAGKIFEIQELEGDLTVPVPEEPESPNQNPVSCQSEDLQPTETQPNRSAAVDNISQQGLVDPMAARFASDRRTYHKALRSHEASQPIHKELHGDKFSNDWHPALVKAVQKKLAACGKPAMHGDACSYLAYRAKPEGVTGADIDLIVSIYETAIAEQQQSVEKPQKQLSLYQPIDDPDSKARAAQAAKDAMAKIKLAMQTRNRAAS
jgi:hypothetical protein